MSNIVGVTTRSVFYLYCLIPLGFNIASSYSLPHIIEDIGSAPAIDEDTIHRSANMRADIAHLYAALTHI